MNTLEKPVFIDVLALLLFILNCIIYFTAPTTVSAKSMTLAVSQVLESMEILKESQVFN